jgi:hypothetical protein
MRYERNSKMLRYLPSCSGVLGEAPLSLVTDTFQTDLRCPLSDASRTRASETNKGDYPTAELWATRRNEVPHSRLSRLS